MRYPRKLVAKNHREAYELWALHALDPALMANRDAATTRRKLSRLVERLPIREGTRLLDVGPGDGALFHLVAGRGAQCHGVDPSARAVERLGEMCGDLPDVELKVGTADRIPYPDETFDVIVVNSVFHTFRDRKEVVAALSELCRVCRPLGVVFVGELPFRNEFDGGVLPHMTRKLLDFGPAEFLRVVYQVYARPMLRGEPIVVYPTESVFVPEEEFVAMCRSLGMEVEVTERHRELRRASTTRNDYLLRRSPRAGRALR